ncbi:MAG TPA: type II toxin-antitoxin system RelE/ParE family toxin [bacterium]|jgi:toxin ParE1/3/4|nr:type II toxin-antitoxin system RelE/ParE family toxin [bacterium]
MVEIRWTPQAVDDLESIADFIAKDSPYYARLFVINVLGVVERLPKFPKSGHIVPRA